MSSALNCFGISVAVRAPGTPRELVYGNLLFEMAYLLFWIVSLIGSRTAVTSLGRCVMGGWVVLVVLLVVVVAVPAPGNHWLPSLH